jgi:hypothetical protein
MSKGRASRLRVTILVGTVTVCMAVRQSVTLNLGTIWSPFLQSDQLRPDYIPQRHTPLPDSIKTLRRPSIDVHLVEALLPPGCGASVLSVFSVGDSDMPATHSSTTVLFFSIDSGSSADDSRIGTQMGCSLGHASRWCGPLIELERRLVVCGLVQRPLCEAPFSVIRAILSPSLFATNFSIVFCFLLVCIRLLFEIGNGSGRLPARMVHRQH